ncbi:MAG: hypothetical protein GQ537_00330 [Gammaproteobacteria bacterium]|nr:hypothetical protein [Gammaproteobacteria bacterium]
MKSLLFITTSNGVYVLDTESGKSKCFLGNKHTPGFFKKKARGYFGITFHKKSGKIIVASREKLGTKRHNKPTTDTKLHAINPATLQYEQIATVLDTHDVHQITSDEDLIYITDTGKNRVVVYNLDSQSIVKLVNVGTVRDDINHINAVLIHDDELLIGLNNRGNESEILHVKISDIFKTDDHQVDAKDIGTISAIKDVTHSHDLEICGDMLVCCSSHNGQVINTETAEVLIKENLWVRGLAANESCIWAGESFITTRKQRHNKSIDGYIHEYSLDDYSTINTYTLTNSGQVNDLIII